MKKLFLAGLVAICLAACKDRNHDTVQSNFCEIQRQFVENLENKTGELVYLNDKARYAIKYYPALPTVDEVTYLVLCEKPNNIETNASVKFSCKTWKFNDNEGYNPAVGGSHFYFVTQLNILKL